MGGGIQLDKITAGDHGVDQSAVLGIRPVTPMNRIGLGQARNIFNPILKRRIRRAHRKAILQR
jgi:hypothetical protein